MIENNENLETQVEEVEVDIQEDAAVESKTTSPDDELDNYTKSVSKRINKKNAQVKAAEERAEYFEQIARQQQEQLDDLKQQLASIEGGKIVDI